MQQQIHNYYRLQTTVHEHEERRKKKDRLQKQKKVQCISIVDLGEGHVYLEKGAFV